MIVAKVLPPSAVVQPGWTVSSHGNMYFAMSGPKTSAGSGCGSGIGAPGSCGQSHKPTLCGA